MWFAKWFGGRREAEDDDEPARFTAPARIEQPQAAPRPAATVKPARSADKSKGGFDPYNSGSFERRNAWERVNKR